MGKTIRGICKLCDLEKDIIRSHIIPDSFYREIKKGSGGNFVLINNDPNSKMQVSQTGVWEHLLCAECDNKLGRYDGYALNFCKQYWGTIITNEKRLIASNVDYKLMRLFQISVLWRAQITTRYEFQSSKFHPKHEARLKQMILNEDIGKYYEYGCFLYLNVDEGKVLKYLIKTPSHYTFKGFNGVDFTFGGFTWAFLVNSHMEKFPFNDYLLQDGKDVPITIAEFYKLKTHRSLLKQFQEQGKLQRMIDYFDKHP